MGCAGLDPSQICFFFLCRSSDLNLSHNQMSKLPDELADLASLLRLDMSHNSFLSLPAVVFKMPKLRQLLANNNSIIGKFDRLTLVDSLKLRYEVRLNSTFLYICRYWSWSEAGNIRFVGIGRFAEQPSHATMLRIAEKCPSQLPHRINGTTERRLGRSYHLSVCVMWSQISLSLFLSYKSYHRANPITSIDGNMHRGGSHIQTPYYHFIFC